MFTIGGTIVSWISKLQKVVSLSTIEAEYVAYTEVSKEMIWLQRFMEELGKKQRTTSCTVTVRVPFTLQITQPSIQRLSIYS